ncbi:uncharacterized protein V6R79_010153 [Siganus canaliculatus]
MPETGCTSITNLRYPDGTEGSSSNPTKFNNQDYAQLKDYASRSRRPFVDNTFPPNNRSLGDLPDMSSWREAEVEWLRPSDILKAQGITDEPVFCSKGKSRFDFGQGSVGNCWFLASISALTFNKNLLAQVVPMDQTFKNYGGIFHFRFWRFGKWVDVVVDDHLPTLNKRLLSVHTNGKNEFWVPLLEKAYAKVCGTYADMNAGLPSEACKDFCGGVHQTYILREEHSSGHDKELFQQISRATGCKSMVTCGTPQKGNRLVNTVADSGIVDAHAYSVTGVTEVNYYGTKEKLVRVMNPWGKTEWKGKWSDKSDAWERVSPEDREKCADREDGEFWMEMEQFCNHFNILTICCENPNFIDGDLSCQWKSMTYDGRWVAGRSAGGSLSNSTFETNPQYRIEVSKIDRTEDEDKNVLVSLMQIPQQRRRKDARSHPIGITIFKTPKGRLDYNFFRRNRPMKYQQMYTYERDLIEQHSMEPGEYVIVPSTMKPYQTGEFVLTVYTKADAKISPHDHDEDEHEHEHEHHEEETKPTDNDHDDDHDHDHDKEDNTKDSSYTLFRRYADQKGELDARQLQKLLNDNFPHGTSYGFGLDTSRSMIALMDTDQRMGMSFSEFSNLWKKIDEYKKLFQRSDKNRNGSLSYYELKEAIEAAGMDANDGMVRLMMFRYSGYSNTNMESFITLMLRLNKMSDLFKNRSSNGVIHMSWEEFSNFGLYN